MKNLNHPFIARWYRAVKRDHCLIKLHCIDFGAVAGLSKTQPEYTW